MKLRFQAGTLTHKSERLAKRVAGILRAALGRMGKAAAKAAKATLPEEKVAKAADQVDGAVDEIMAALAEEYAPLPDKLRRPLMDAARQGVLQMKPQISDAVMIADANEAAENWADDRAAELVGMKWVDDELIENPNAEWAISDTVRDRLNAIVKRAFAKVTSFEDVIGEIENMPEFSEARAEMIARTEISRAQIQGNIALWNQTGLVTTYDWLLSEDEDVCEECESLADGGPYTLGVGPLPIDDSHPNCVLGLTIIETEFPATAFTRRRFHGEVITITCFDGTQLTLTPNHPVLTVEGWLPAGQILKDSYLFKGASQNHVIGSPFALKPDNKLMPSTIEEIFSALLKSDRMSSVCVKSATIDFHGDGIADSEINIVRANGLLPNVVDAGFKKEPGKEDLPSSHQGRFILNCESAQAQFTEIGLSSANGRMSGGSSFEPLASIEALVAKAHNLVQGSNTETSFPEPSGERIPLNADASCDNRERFAVDVSLVKVRDIEKSVFSGHVYNLQTVNGYYFANGIIAHNCRCIIVSNTFELPKAAAQQSVITKTLNTEAGTMPEKNKAATAAKEHFFLALPITKFDEEQRIVEGIATAEVLDTQGDIVDFDAACKAFDSWEGNVREQHDKTKAVGRAISYTKDAEGKLIHVAAHISKGAQDTWEKVKDGTLKYFSVGCPFGSYERKPEVVKVDGVDKRANRLYLNALSELSLVDQGACPAAKIGLWKTADGCSDVLAEEAPAAEAEAAPAEKLTEDVSNYADPGWQEDGKKRYPLDTEEHVQAAARYFGRPKNRKKYSDEHAKAIDGKIDTAKKKFKIGEYAEKCDGTMDLCKYVDGEFTPLSWVPMNQWPADQPGLCCVPRTFGAIWEDTEDYDIFPIMGQMFGKAIANILCSKLTGEQQRALIQQSFDELMEELADEFMEASEQASEFADAVAAQKFVVPQLTKAGARHNKADMESIQTMHDHTVKLGATCKAAKDDSSKAASSTLEKAMEPLVLIIDGLAEKIKGLDVTKAAMDADIAKLADAIAPVLIEKVGATLASKEDVASVSAIASKAEGDIAAANAAVEGVTKRLEVVEKQPASLPVARPAFGMAVAAAEGGAVNKLADEIAALEKVQAGTGDPLVKEAIGKELFLLKMKAGR